MLKLIDATGPFFLGYNKKTINWSKIPFEHLEQEGTLDANKLRRILPAFRNYVKRIRRIGYNAITLDDLAHLVSYPCYDEPTKTKLTHYRRLYTRLITIARNEQLKVYITTDAYFQNTRLRQAIREHGLATIMRQGITRALRDYDISGIILRIGESDGIDVDTDFTSTLYIRTPRQANRLLKRLLPTFEQHNKTLIIRTWTIGAHPIGDLMWNPHTHACVFAGIHSPHLIISHKYGESDFYRYLPLNRNALDPTHKTIIEFQTRREYEGFGTLPNYTGWQYEHYLRTLRQLPHFQGISVWCQTGGWGRTRDLTYVENSSPWVELNTETLLRILEGTSANDAARDHALTHGHSPDTFLTFLAHNARAIDTLLYNPAFARQERFIGGTRAPPLLWVYWDTILLTPSIQALYQKNADLSHFQEGLCAINHATTLAAQLDLDYTYAKDSLTLLAHCQHALFFGTTDHLRTHINTYTTKHPGRYRVILSCDAIEHNLRAIIAHLFRTQPPYRAIDAALFRTPLKVAIRYLADRYQTSNKLAYGMRIGTILQ